MKVLIIMPHTHLNQLVLLEAKEVRTSDQDLGYVCGCFLIPRNLPMEPCPSGTLRSWLFCRYGGFLALPSGRQRHYCSLRAQQIIRKIPLVSSEVFCNLLAELPLGSWHQADASSAMLYDCDRRKLVPGRFPTHDCPLILPSR